MQDPFDQKKASILKEIGITDVDTPDASPKGTIDEKCLPIMRIINTDADMVTTSSCSGRVSVFLEGIKNKADLQIGAKGNEGRWIFVTHDSSDLADWYENVQFKYGTPTEVDANTRYILYKFEPLILHVKCRSLESANALYTTAMGCGFRESGIGTNNIVAIRISIKLDIPIGYYNSASDSLVSIVDKNYLKMITKLSLDRFQENERKIKVLEDAIALMKQGGAKSAKKQEESKEERQERKRREGLARREGVRAEKEQKKQEKAAAVAATAVGASAPAQS
ncbi:tRNA wybutosine-synthesizing protein 3 [[Candida] railenensis]|uniref:tRNA wybutosine-synthesizing protein 3 n=1 Tax=[Candida] railenensis TaxID=45579 RepID=A0A9P0QQ62_9ASCO|nr:tRNA wybutosine-synthesizing protein 3 [[Candida] railenensis]